LEAEVREALPEERGDRIERMLKERGVTFGRVRIAVARSGIAVGFPRDPMLHVSWWALAAVLVVVKLLRRR
jgi:hypothetical protein